MARRSTRKVLRRRIQRAGGIKGRLALAKDGIITGAADNDPSGIVTYTQVGALTRFGLLWLMPLTLPMLIVAEEMSARIGVVTKKGLNRVIEDEYGQAASWFTMVLVVVCNTATLGADMAAMAAVLELFTHVSFLYFLIPIAAAILYTLMRESYTKVSGLLYLIAPILLVYVVTGFLTRPSWLPIVRSTFVPTLTFSPTFLTTAVALFGTTISAYLLFWQTTEEVEDRHTVDDLKSESLGIRIGMVYSNVIFYFVILTAAVVLFGRVGAGNVNTWTAATASLALRPLAGNFAYVLFSVGVLFSGALAVPVLALSTAYVVRDTFRWTKEDMGERFSRARGFYIVIGLSLAFGSGLSLVGVKPMAMLYYSQVLQGALTPILLVFVALVSNNARIMGRHTNGRWTNFIAWAAVVVMFGFSILMFRQLLSQAKIL